jgi:hypothetical protein
MRNCFFALSLLVFAACNQSSKHNTVKFNKIDWVTKDDFDYTLRDAMLNDLLTHHQLKGLTYKQLVDSLGEPANYGNDKDSIYYDIVVNYGYLDPKSGKYLAIHINKDSIVTGFKVVEWKNRHANE